MRRATQSPPRPTIARTEASPARQGPIPTSPFTPPVGCTHQASEHASFHPARLPPSVCVFSPLRAGTPTLFLIHAQRNGGSATLHGAGQPCPAPTWPPSAHRARSTPHTPTSPHQRREHASKQAGQRGGGTTLPHNPKQAHTSNHANTPTNTGSSANTKPQPPASKHAHNRYSPTRANTFAPTPQRVGKQGSVSAKQWGSTPA